MKTQWLAVVTFLALVLVACSGSSAPDDRTLPTVEPGCPPTCSDPTFAVSLTVTYEACVRDAGLTPFEAQVLTFSNGAPQFVKTAPEVPADIHGPCWESIGGEPTGLSSYGR